MIFHSHLDLAHFWWSRLVGPNDMVIDMTCGTGQDTLFLSTLKPKRLISLDIQPQALERAKIAAPEAEYILQDHALFPETLQDNSVKLAVYNLGWLPGSDKKCTTMVDTTLKSVFGMLPKMTVAGLISITCYPGHPEGEKEQAALVEAVAKLSPFHWMVCHHQFLNRKKSPSLLFVQKK